MSDDTSMEKGKELNLASENLVVTFEGIKSVFPLSGSERVSTMAIEPYAASLKALSNIIKEANKTINRKNIDVSIEISTTKAGSVTTVLTIFGVAAAVLIPIHFLISILKNLGFDTESFAPSFTSCLEKIKELKKKEKQELGVDSEEKEYLESLPRELCKLCENPKVINGFQQMVKPVKNRKVEKISVIRLGAKQGFSVDRSNVHLYDIEPAEEIEVREFSDEFKIETLSFRPQGKWKLYNNNTPIFTAKVEDDEFLRRINENKEFFLKDSKLTCRIIEKKNINSIGQKSKYYIREIKSEHPIQSALPFPEQ